MRSFAALADSRRNGTLRNTPFLRLDTKTYLRLPRERNRPETRTGGRGLRRRFFYGHTPHYLAPATPLCYNQSKKGEINMDGENRRKTLLDLLAAAEEPLSGSALAKKLGVSRQVIVQDIALLRATNRDILSTARDTCFTHLTAPAATAVLWFPIQQSRSPTN